MGSSRSGVVVYTVTRGKQALAKKSFKALRLWAGIDYEHYVFDNGSDPEMVSWLESEKEKGHIQKLFLAGENMGQNIAANVLLDEIEWGEWILRWDPDAIPRTRRFLKKLVGCAEVFVGYGIYPVLSPQITKLKHPPQPIGAGDDVGFEYHVMRVLGGICRLHHYQFFRDWRFNKFGALGFGEALEVADRALELNVPKVRIPDIEVEHAYGEDGQAEKWPELFSFEGKEIPRYVGYGL